MSWLFPVITELQLGSHGVHVFYITTILTMVVAAILVYIYARRLHEQRWKVIVAMFLLGLGIIYGAKVFSLFGPWGWRSSAPLLERIVWTLNPLSPGLVLWGGIVGAIIMLVVSRKLLHPKGTLGEHMDIFAFAFPVALLIARIGCLFINDHPEKVTTLAYGWVRFSDPGMLPFGLTKNAPSYVLENATHPSVLIYVITMLIISVWMWKWYARPRPFAGALFVLSLSIYAITRFLNEFLRMYDWYFLGLTASQYVSLGMLAVCIYIIYKKGFTPLSFLKAMFHPQKSASG